MENSSKRGIILIPYAYSAGANTGVNLGDKSRQREIYLRNCCVACISACAHNDAATDVALVTNVEPDEPYRSLLERHGVRIIRQDFDRFDFGGEYTWSLAFFKLCALHHVVREMEYEYYAVLDSDVYVQHHFRDIWAECEQHVLLYDINHGLQVADYRKIVTEMRAFDPAVEGGGIRPITAASFSRRAATTPSTSRIGVWKFTNGCGRRIS